ncbi:hypothetical protein GQ457_02G008310 [Hibiscus cannabinus]
MKLILLKWTQKKIIQRSVDTLMVISLKLSKFDGVDMTDAQQYRSVVGALLYICRIKPDIIYSVNKVAQYIQQPKDVH